MASLFKPHFTKPVPPNAELFTRKGRRWARWIDAKGRTREAPLSADGQRVRLAARKWYGEYRDADGIVQTVPLATDKTAAGQMLAELVRKAELGKAGVVDPYEEHRKRPLLEHLENYRRYLEARGNTSGHVAKTCARIRTILDGCRFVFIANLSASRVQEFLADLRRTGRARKELDPAKAEYTKREVAAILDVKPAGIGPLVSRHRLAATGNGKARRYPRETVEALQDRLCRGCSIQTVNHYATAIKGLCRWLVKDRRMEDNPLAHLEGGNAKLDRRHDRRPLSADELRLVLQVAYQSDRVFRGLAGWDRHMIYATACVSGFG